MIPLLFIAAAVAAERWSLIFKVLASVSIASMLIVTAQTPVNIPEASRDPLAVAMSQLSRGSIADGWGNLGMLIGLQGIASLGPLILVVAAFLLTLRTTRQ